MIAGLLVAISFIGLVIAGTIFYVRPLPTNGVVKSANLNIEYADGTPVITVDWGSLANGSTTTFPTTMYIVNHANSQIDVTMTVENATTNIQALTYDLTTPTIPIGGRAPFQLTLALKADAIPGDTFHADLRFTGTAE